MNPPDPKRVKRQAPMEPYSTPRPIPNYSNEGGLFTLQQSQTQNSSFGSVGQQFNFQQGSTFVVSNPHGPHNGQPQLSYDQNYMMPAPAPPFGVQGQLQAQPMNVQAHNSGNPLGSSIGHRVSVSINIHSISLPRLVE